MLLAKVIGYTFDLGLFIQFKLGNISLRNVSPSMICPG